jgi:2-succinyl-5-enolpyruvyl-6-hydroxy-3-cyclohexene-1-carboxylate synthase
VLNLSPAVAEAFHQGLALVVLTADRPRELLPQFNNQVIDQHAPYFNHSKGFLEFPAQLRMREDLQKKFLAVEVLLAEAKKAPRGPVHINLPLLEPLYVKLPEPMLIPAREQNHSRTSEEESLLPEAALKDRKVLILAGMASASEELSRVLEELVAKGQVAVVAENISNLKSENFVSMPELILAGANEGEQADLIPDVVIAFGKQMVSKRMKLFVNSLEKAEVVVLPEQSSVPEFLRALGGDLEKQRENLYKKRWLDIEKRESSAALTYLESAPFSNLVVVHKVLEQVPGGTIVHLGNSSTIRNSQLFPVRSELSYYSNRGTSGIDGSLSAAVGAAMLSSNLHLLLIGDLSFVYDSNGLWNRDFPENLKIVILNDGGGGIFRLLEGPGQMEFFEEFSVTHHPVSLELLSQSFGRNFQRVNNLGDLKEQLNSLFSPGNTLSVLEVDTSSAENSRIFKELFR